MSLSYSAQLKSTRMQAVITAIDAQPSAGTIEVGTSLMASVLAVIPLVKPSFTESGGVITMASVPRSGTATAAGTAANARIKDGSGNIIVSNLTVGTGGTDIILNNATIAVGQTVTLTSGTISHAP